MRILIAEDDFITSKVMLEILKEYGECVHAVNGAEAVIAFNNAITNEKHFDVAFLDIMMPIKDGQEVLLDIREIESDRGITGLDGCRIIMTTALDDFDNIRSAFKNQCDGYIVKPIDVEKVVSKLKDLSLI